MLSTYDRLVSQERVLTFNDAFVAAQGAEESVKGHFKTLSEEAGQEPPRRDASQLGSM